MRTITVDLKRWQIGNRFKVHVVENCDVDIDKSLVYTITVLFSNDIEDERY